MRQIGEPIQQCPCGHVLPDKWPSPYCSTECHLRDGMLHVQEQINRGFAVKSAKAKHDALAAAKDALIRAMCGYPPREAIK